MLTPTDAAPLSATPDTHEVFNQPFALENYNSFLSDTALQEAVTREGAAWATADLTRFGAESGRAETILQGFQANENKPCFKTHDRFGRRVDEVEFHPAYHQLMNTAITEGLHASPWQDPKPGAHVARAAKYYLHTQVEAGHGCPITMTFAAIPALRKQPNIAEIWEPLITNHVYDHRNIPFHQKNGLTLGMAMTEKQGGSDVRTNTTRAEPLGAAGPGEIYSLVGHKYFVSAPMCDGFLLLANAAGGLSCFLVPRWRPDGTKNPLQLQQLKQKMGNVSNASSETELRGAWGWLIGEEGRGVANILEMVSMTRFDCMMGSSAGMRQAIVQITHHCHHRDAFGKPLDQQPLMQNVLADLILENEAALALTLRIARALDESKHSPEAAALLRLGTALGKYWICKRTPGHAYEAMECIGGSAVMETSIMPRLYREAPVNAIWEGSGNIQALDMLRALSRSPETLESYYQQLSLSLGKNNLYDLWLKKIQASLADKDNIEYRARDITEKMALALQANVLLETDNALIADAFCSARLRPDMGLNYGTLPKGIDCSAIIERARPELSRS